MISEGFRPLDIETNYLNVRLILAITIQNASSSVHPNYDGNRLIVDYLSKELLKLNF